MFKAIQSGLAKFFSPKMLLVLIISMIAIWGLMSYNGQMKLVRDTMEDGSEAKEEAKEEDKEATAADPAPAAAKAEAGYALQSVANPMDLLPKDKNSEWNNLNPINVADEGVKMPDLLEAGYHIGLDTIGQSMRNANLQLRSDPVIPKSNVGPWNQSTIEADNVRQPLEIGR